MKQQNKIINIRKFIQDNKIINSNNHLLQVDFKTLKNIYKTFNLDKINYENINEDIILFLELIHNISNNSREKELKSWIINIKHTYEIINKLIIKKYNLLITFEQKIYNTNQRIDIVIKHNNNYLLIESSYPYSKELEIKKQKQINNYKENFSKVVNSNNIKAITLFNDYSKSRNNVLKAIKEL